MCTTIGILLLLLQLKRYADAHPAGQRAA